MICKFKHSAFTLIELILVVAIIAMLTGAMMPVIISARQKARAAKFAQLLDVLTKACMLYYSDTGQYAGETTDGPVNNWAQRRLSVVPPAGAIPGWDGPYIERPLTSEDAILGDRFIISNLMMGDFDLDGDGTIDKHDMTPGNSMDFWFLQESAAKALDETIDANIPGDWKNTGRLRFYDMWGLRGVIIYLTGGS
ncbi:MAG: type II secretion system protein [Candidatus Omnitrophica bacterium]|nr:type II secretion system protein [Candidatus Omnitrophota bacterium]